MIEDEVASAQIKRYLFAKLTLGGGGFKETLKK